MFNDCSHLKDSVNEAFGGKFGKNKINATTTPICNPL